MRFAFFVRMGRGECSKFEGKWEREYGGCRLAWAVAKNLFLQSIVVRGMLRVIRSVGRHFVVVFLVSVIVQ